MMAALGAAVALLGTGFIVVAGIGVLRLPDPLARMHAATKAGTLGATLVLAGTAFLFGDGGTWVTAGLTALVLLLTLPLAAQVLGRASYLSGAPMAPLGEPDPLAAVLRRNGDAGPDETTRP